jgi:hypothetical protein
MLNCWNFDVEVFIFFITTYTMAATRYAKHLTPGERMITLALSCATADHNCQVSRENRSRPAL